MDSVSPDALLSDFRGLSLSKILIFTIVFHLVFLTIFSPGYLYGLVVGSGTDAMTEQEKVDEAVREMTAEARALADRYGIDSQELVKRFSEGRKPTAAPTAPTSEGANQADDNAAPTGGMTVETTTTTVTEQGADAGREVSEYEKTLEVEEQGPVVPDLIPDNDDDMFAPQQ